ncbi:hypothetical protein CWE15_02125 [Aliidiomarina taiwanensis]|uniref:DUF3080 domain-containing protein n=1 Tax=Aliidiomarina taiwanensis TaxID=946228 RepID=A0A432X9T7_9GAMM|nr:DUF3080 family protein [Aliidiomarina taiwanensis]RUO44001.1 hypothetical protein CWE15_02125 [Aliidiomarina taiwanensis]
MKYISKIMQASVPNSGLCCYIARCSFFLLALLTVACSDSQEALMEDYSKRIERLSQVPAVHSVQVLHPVPPQVSELRKTLPDVRISLLDSFRLSNCRLGQVVAERNSSLGKVMTPANQLLYEVEVTRALRDCLSQPANLSQQLKEDLASALASKERSLHLAIHNFLTTDDIWRQQFRVGSKGLPLHNQDDFTNTYIAISYFAHTLTLLAESPYHVDLDLSSWHTHVETLHRSQFLPAYWRTLAYMPAQLDAISVQLQQARSHIGCSPVARPQSAEYMHNVMMSLYIGQLQPALARWHHYGQQLEPELNQLLALVQKNAWRSHAQALGLGAVQKLQESTRQHTKQWQDLLQACRLTPHGNPINGA